MKNLPWGSLHTKPWILPWILELSDLVLRTANCCDGCKETSNLGFQHGSFALCFRFCSPFVSRKRFLAFTSALHIPWFSKLEVHLPYKKLFCCQAQLTELKFDHCDCFVNGCYSIKVVWTRFVKRCRFPSRYVQRTTHVV